MVLLNCGATEDVRSLCDLPTNIRIVIIDHHRPIWHGHNDPQVFGMTGHGWRAVHASLQATRAMHLQQRQTWELSPMRSTVSSC